MRSFHKRCTIKAPVSRVWDWHQNVSAFRRILPSWLNVKILKHSQTKLELLTRTGIISFKSIHHIDHNPSKHEFTDTQTHGLFNYWVHKHKMRQDKNGDTILEEHIDYELPLPWILEPLLGPMIDRNLKKMFKYRFDIMKRDLGTHFFETNKLKIAVFGATGFIGKNLVDFLQSQGHEVLKFSTKKRKGYLYWNPRSSNLKPTLIEGLDAIVNLAGATIDKRWNDSYKEELTNSRIDSTKLIVKTIAKLKVPPRVLLNASGINIYGSHREQRLHERSTLGKDGFLTNLCKKWEETANKAQTSGTRVVNLRIGPVLDPKGGILKKVMPIFKWCLGGRLGNGLQSMSWISLDDLIDGIYMSMLNPQIVGPVNLVSPNPMSNFRFKQTLGRTLKRPTWLPTPAFILKKIYGQEMVEETLLSSLKVQPQKLQRLGFKFRYPKLQQLLKHSIF